MDDWGGGGGANAGSDSTSFAPLSSSGITPNVMGSPKWQRAPRGAHSLVGHPFSIRPARRSPIVVVPVGGAKTARRLFKTGGFGVLRFDRPERPIHLERGASGHVANPGLAGGGASNFREICSTHKEGQRCGEAWKVDRTAGVAWPRKSAWVVMARGACNGHLGAVARGN